VKPLVHFGGNCVSFRSDDPAILNALATHFSHCLSGNDPIIAEYHITVLSEMIYSISVDGSIVYSSLSLEQTLQRLMQDSITCLNRDCAIGPVFHAAALEKTGRGLILCGQSGSGKSSLTAWLLASGLHYLSDEVITYDLREHKIRGLSRSLVLKRGSAFIWQRWLEKTQQKGFRSFADGSAWIDPCLLHADGVCSQTTPQILIFPHYASQASFHIQKLTAAEALFRLLQNLVNARNLPKNGMEEAANLARRVPAYSLEYSDIESAGAWIQNQI
jgi:hypothetical protein